MQKVFLTSCLKNFCLLYFFIETMHETYKLGPDTQANVDPKFVELMHFHQQDFFHFILECKCYVTI